MWEWVNKSGKWTQEAGRGTRALNERVNSLSRVVGLMYARKKGMIPSFNSCYQLFYVVSNGNYFTHTTFLTSMNTNLIIF